MAGLNFNLLDQLTFYGAYHSNKWNQASLLLLLHPSGNSLRISSLVDALSYHLQDSILSEPINHACLHV